MMVFLVAHICRDGSGGSMFRSTDDSSSCGSPACGFCVVLEYCNGQFGWLGFFRKKNVILDVIFRLFVISYPTHNSSFIVIAPICVYFTIVNSVILLSNVVTMT